MNRGKSLVSRRSVLAGLAAGGLLSTGALPAAAASSTQATGRRESVPGATFVLLHSPLVGPHTWAIVADLLRQAGRRVRVPSLADALRGPPPYYPALASAVAHDIAGGEPSILVGHSGAGALLPAAAEAIRAAGAPSVAAIFVDAILPHPGRNWMSTAPPALQEKLEGLAQGERLAPWHEWLPPGVLEKVMPDAAQRDAFIADLPRVPRQYLMEAAPDVPAWPPERCGYLQLSQAYAREAGEAERLGWPVLRERLNHLAMLTHPQALADRLEQIVARWRTRGPAGE